MIKASDIPVEHHETLESTNKRARQIVESGQIADSPILVVADSQTAGVGRRNREWKSPVGGLWCTLIWPVLANVQGVLDGLGLRVGVAVVHAIEHTLDTHGLVKDVDLKWPNDVLIDGRKVAGILIESVSHDGTRFLLIGVGVNVNNTLPALDNAVIRPTSLREIIGHDVINHRLRDILVERLARACSTTHINQETLLDARRYLFGVGTHIAAQVEGKPSLTGTLEGINDQGEILCETSQGITAIPRGAEIVWKDLEPLSDDQQSG